MNYPDQFEKVLSKLDTLQDRIGNIDVTMAKNTASLEEHIRRTNLLEQELKPIKSHVQLINAMAKILSLGVSIAAAVRAFRLWQ